MASISLAPARGGSKNCSTNKLRKLPIGESLYHNLLPIASKLNGRKLRNSEISENRVKDATGASATGAPKARPEINNSGACLGRRHGSPKKVVKMGETTLTKGVLPQKNHQRVVETAYISPRVVKRKTERKEDHVGW